MSRLIPDSCIADLLGVDLCACDEKTARTIRDLVGEVSAEANFCANRDLCANYDIVECIAPGNTNCIFLKFYPLIKIHKVECSICCQELTDYCVDSINQGILSRCCGWCKCYCGGEVEKSIKVHYAAGFITEEQTTEVGGPFEGCEPTVPADLKAALCSLALTRYHQRCIPAGVTSAKLLSASMTFSSDSRTSSQITSVFKRYRSIRV